MPDHPPITLAIETSNPASGGGGDGAGSAAPQIVAVGLGRGSSVADAEWLGGEPLAPSSRHDDALMPAIDRLCRLHGVRPIELSRIAVSLGPGGFTGLRIAVMTAKLIAEATGAECVGVPTAEALMLGVEPGEFSRAENGAAFGVCLAWKRDDVWRQRFTLNATRDGWAALDAGGIVPLNAAAEGVSSLIADAEFVRLLRERAIDVSRVTIHQPCFDARHVFLASLGRAATDPVALLPIYPREPEAVTKWRELHRKDR